MFTRSILIPSLLVCAISAPFLFSESNVKSNGREQLGTFNGFQGQPATFSSSSTGTNAFLPAATSGNSNSRFQNLPIQSQTAPLGGGQLAFPNSYQEPTINPAQRTVPFGLVSQSQQPQPLQSIPQSFPLNESINSSQIVGTPQFVNSTTMSGYNQIGPPNGITTLMPDTSSAQTLIFPGDQYGPDLSAPPMEFLPVTDFTEIFRFDVSPSWVKSRWKRISTNPGDYGLHGLRVALVTGTNSWDLSGALTYYFDAHQRVQRITFRGWTGDSSRLIGLLSDRFGFEAHQTQLAGFYATTKRRKTTGAMLMKHPTVIYAENPAQQLALVLEINDPDGKFEISQDMKLLIEGSLER